MTAPGGVYLVSPADTGGVIPAGQQGSGLGDSASPKKMARADVQNAVFLMTTDAIQYVDLELSPKRAQADNYYQGLAFGNEKPGRSQVVSTDLRDTVRKIIPSLLRIFFGAERVVEYSPASPQQVQAAEQATAFISDVIVRQDNPGFLVVHDWLKDCLIKGLGIVKSWYDDTPETIDRTGTYLSMEQVLALQMDPTIEVQELSPCEGQPPGANLYDVEYRQTKHEGRILFRCLPPEEFLFTRGARTIAADSAQPGVALYVAHRTELMRSQLLSMGVKESDIDEWGYKDASLDTNLEEIARQKIVKPDQASYGPIATRKILYIEAYPYLDVDGDGIAELRRVCLLGPAFHVISDEPWDDRPFSVICPDPEPHTIIGQGMGDYTMDLQRINSMIQRSMLDSLALSVHNRQAYDETAVNQADILNTAIGAPIRTQGAPANAIMNIAHEFVGAQALEVLQYFESVKESRVGVTRASAGLDADTLQSTTKAAVSATFTQAQQHIEVMARILGETGFKHLYRRLYKLVVEHPEPARMMKFRGSYVPVDPTNWPPDLGVTVKVAIGAGLDDDKFAVLQGVAADQMQIIQAFGLNQPLVTPQSMRETRVKMLQLKGREDAESFYPDVPQNWQPQPPPPSPEAQVAAAETTKANALAAKHQSDAQLDVAKHEATVVQKAEELRLKALDLRMSDARERQKIQNEHDLRVQEMGLRHEAALTHTGAQTEIAREKLEAAAATTAHQTITDAHQRATEALAPTAPKAAEPTTKKPKRVPK